MRSKGRISTTAGTVSTLEALNAAVDPAELLSNNGINGININPQSRNSKSGGGQLENNNSSHHSQSGTKRNTGKSGKGNKSSRSSTSPGYERLTKSTLANRTQGAIALDNFNDGLTTAVGQFTEKHVSFICDGDESEQQSLMQTWTRLDGLDLRTEAEIVRTQDRRMKHSKLSHNYSMSNGTSPKTSFAGNEDDPSSTLILDTSFPPTMTSLYSDFVGRPYGMCENIVWERLNGTLVIPHARLCIVPGKLRDQYLLSAMAMIASKQTPLYDIVVSDAFANVGLHTFRFFKNAEWVNVTVDNYVPCDGDSNNSASPLFARSGNGGEMWPALLEKAYAKLHHTYYALEHGNICEAFVDLTGGYCTTLVWTDAKKQDMNALNRLWSDLRERVVGPSSEHCIVSACTTDKEVHEQEASAAGSDGTGRNGILNGLAYIVLDLREVSNGLRLVRLSCPWNTGLWTGPWSDGSVEWSQPEYSSLKAELGYTFKDDGTFYMAFKDFVDVFRIAFEGHIPPPNWHEVVITRPWLGDVAGGPPPMPSTTANVSPKHGTSTISKSLSTKGITISSTTAGTWTNNPQFLIRPKKQASTAALLNSHSNYAHGMHNTDIVIRLAQQDSRVSSHCYVPLDRRPAVGMMLLAVRGNGVDPMMYPFHRAVHSPSDSGGSNSGGSAGGSGGSRVWKYRKKDVLSIASLSTHREVTIVSQISAEQPSVVIPYMNAAGAEGPFFLRIFSSGPIEVDMLPSPLCLTMEGEWESGKAGGMINDSTWGSNPQYLLRVFRKTNVTIILDRTSDAEMDELYCVGSGFYDVAEDYGNESTKDNQSAISKADTLENGVVKDKEDNDSNEGDTGDESEDEDDLIDANDKRAASATIGIVVSSSDRCVDGHSRRNSIDAEREICILSDFSKTDSAILYEQLEAGYYTITPCASVPGVLGSYSISFFSSEELELKEFPHTRSKVIKGMWVRSMSSSHQDSSSPSLSSLPSMGRAAVSTADGKSRQNGGGNTTSGSGSNPSNSTNLSNAGGCDLHPTWPINPKYVLHVEERCRVRVGLKRFKARGQVMTLKDMIGFYVLKMPYKSLEQNKPMLKQVRAYAWGLYYNHYYYLD